MAARPDATLGPQFYSGEALARLRTSDFPGRVGDRDAEQKLIQHNAEVWGSQDRALQHLSSVRDQVSESGGYIRKAVPVVHKPGEDPMLWDGHHRALHAHQFDLELPVEHYTWDEVQRRG